MPNDMVTIHADILKVTKKFVTVRCGESEETLKLWEVEAEEPLEAGQVNMALRIPRAEADALGLPVAEEMESAPEFSETDNAPEPEEDGSITNAEPTDPVPDGAQTMDITLTILSFSEDGEIATVEDRHGNTADISTTAFTHEQDELSVGDTLLCRVLVSAVEPTDLCPDKTPEDEEDGPSPARGQGSTWLRKDTCTKSFPLSDVEKLELGNAMAKAQERIDELEDDLASIRKSYKARIEEQQEILSQAAKEYRDGKTEPQKVECDVFQDWTTDELVYVTADEAAEEIMRRPMTNDEKRPTLFDAPPDAKGHSAPLGEDPRYRETPAPTPQAWGHTCIDCARMADGQDGAQAEECASCVQSGSGDLDSWQPRRECRTCNYKTMSVSMPPCNTCSRNPEADEDAEDDNWIWAGSESAESAQEVEEEVAHEEEAAPEQGQQQATLQ